LVWIFNHLRDLRDLLFKGPEVPMKASAPAIGAMLVLTELTEGRKDREEKSGLRRPG
jgi:hypothetical protein